MWIVDLQIDVMEYGLDNPVKFLNDAAEMGKFLTNKRATNCKLNTCQCL